MINIICSHITVIYLDTETIFNLLIYAEMTISIGNASLVSWQVYVMQWCSWSPQIPARSLGNVGRK